MSENRTEKILVLDKQTRELLLDMQDRIASLERLVQSMGKEIDAHFNYMQAYNKLHG